MTTGYEPATPPRPDWVSLRPFWGGLLLFLAGFELFLSSNLDPGALQVHFGPSGFLSYLLPAMLVLCGVLAVLSPGQHLFYGIVGLLTALFSLIGLNLGGFFVGMFLGVLGGALTVAWTPNAPAAAPATVEEPDVAEVPGQSTVDDYYARPATGNVYGAPRSVEERAFVDDGAYGESAADSAYGEAYRESTADTAPREGLLTDSLPTATRSPLHSTVDENYDAKHLSEGGAGSADDARPDTDGPLPHRRVPYIGGIVVLVVLGAFAYGAAIRPVSAYAAPPCPTPSKSGAATSTKSPGTSKTTATTPPAATASPTPSPSDGNVFSGIINGIIGIITGGDKNAAPTPTPSDTPTSTPTTAPTAVPPPVTGPTPTRTLRTPSPSCAPSASASPTAPKRATLAAGQPYVANPPSTMLTKLITMTSLSYDGIVNLPTKTGTIPVLKFSMAKSVSTPFELDTPATPKTLLTKSDSLTVDGNVAFYTNSFSGNVLGLIPMTFTPDQPPPLVLPDMFFTDCTIKLVFVQSDVLTAPGLNIGF